MMPVGCYLDTSFLFKLYVAEPDSESAIEWFQQTDSLCMVSSLTDVEMATSLYRKHSHSQAEQAHRAYLQDRQAGTYRFLPVVNETFELAATLAEQYSHSFLLRSLDLLHLATALQYKADEFGTFDDRLAEVANVAGIRVIP